MFRVMVVEDEEIIRKGIIKLIDFDTLHCVLVAECSNGVEGEELIRKLHPDILITDVTMPLMNGIELIERTLDVGVSSIIVSGYNEFSYAKKALALGVCDYVLKPVEQSELNEALARVLEQRKMRQHYQEILKQTGTLEEIQLLSDVRENDELVHDMICYVEAHYMEKLSLEKIARALNYSVSSCEKRFKKVMFITLIDYINRYRVQKAIQYGKEKKYTLQEISERCGFSNYAYFSLVFKKYVGVSLKQFLAMK